MSAKRSGLMGGIALGLLALSLASPVYAAPDAMHRLMSVERQGDIVLVSGKHKKPRQFRHPLNGDVLLGPVSGFVKPDWRTDRREREGSDLGGLIGEATNNFMRGNVRSGGGTTGRTTGPHERPAGVRGQNCGPEYWTAHPTGNSC